MRSVRFILVFALLAVICWTCNIVNAAEDTDTQVSVVTLSIPPTCRLIINNPDASKTLATDSSSEDAFTVGYVEFDPGNPTLRVFSNKGWKLYARSSGFSANGGYIKDTGDLQLKDGGPAHVTMDSFISLSIQDQEVASYTKGVKNENHPCQYNILLDYTKDIPGTYTATVTYTLSTDAS